MTKDIREQFEESMGIHMLVFNWNEAQQKYKGIDSGYSESVFNEYFEIFTKGYQSRQPEIDALKAEIERLKTQGINHAS